MFPAKYQIAGNDTEPKIVQRLVTQMEKVGADLGLDELPPGQAYQTLIIASIVEREAKTADDRPKIARVILNRVNLGMPLQVDATLYYGQDPNTPFDQLKALDTPWNTYLHAGLPPTPIANPGEASIKAVLNPAPDPQTCPDEHRRRAVRTAVLRAGRQGWQPRVRHERAATTRPTSPRPRPPASCRNSAASLRAAVSLCSINPGGRCAVAALRRQSAAFGPPSRCAPIECLPGRRRRRPAGGSGRLRAAVSLCSIDSRRSLRRRRVCRFLRRTDPFYVPWRHRSRSSWRTGGGRPSAVRMVGAWPPPPAAGFDASTPATPSANSFR